MGPRDAGVSIADLTRKSARRQKTVIRSTSEKGSARVALKRRPKERCEKLTARSVEEDAGGATVDCNLTIAVLLLEGLCPHVVSAGKNCNNGERYLQLVGGSLLVGRIDAATRKDALRSGVDRL